MHNAWLRTIEDGIHTDDIFKPGVSREKVSTSAFADAVIARRMQAAIPGGYELAMITNRGVKVWPQSLPETFCTDHWRCRFLALPGAPFNPVMVAELLRRLAEAGVDFVKTEHLFTFDGEPGFSLGQGQQPDRARVQPRGGSPRSSGRSTSKRTPGSGLSTRASRSPRMARTSRAPLSPAAPARSGRREAEKRTG